MPHHFKDFIDVLPFMLSIGEKEHEFSATRIIETLIIALITAVVTALSVGYVTQSVMQNELKHLSAAQADDRQNIKEVKITLAAHLQWELDKATRGDQ